MTENVETVNPLLERKQAVLNHTSWFQQVCRKFVCDHVLANFSALFSAVATNPGLFDELMDDPYDIHCVNDYESAVRNYFDQPRNRTAEDFETFAEQVGWWSTTCDEVARAMQGEVYEPYGVEFPGALPSATVWARSNEEAFEAFEEAEVKPISVERLLYDDDNKWFEENSMRLDAKTTDKFHERIIEQLCDITCDNEWVDVVNALDIDMENFQNDVYEYWCVDDHIAEKLSEVGEKVIDFAGLSVWFRCCTGQAIYMDGCIERIVKNLPEYHDVWRGEW